MDNSQYKYMYISMSLCYHERKIRIFGAGYWRKGKKIYEKENKIQ